MTFDASKEWRIEHFFTDENILKEDVESIKEKNKALKQELNNSQDSSYAKNEKLYIIREYLLMIKDTMDEHQQKSLLLQKLKTERDYLSEKFKMKESEMSNKVTRKIINKQIRDNDPNLNQEPYSNSDPHGSDTTYETSQDEKIHARIIPTLNSEVEKILLDTKRI